MFKVTFNDRKSDIDPYKDWKHGIIKYIRLIRFVLLAGLQINNWWPIAV